MFSARIQQTDIQRSKEVGANIYITKPFKSEELLARIKELVHG
jgi:DNA-binding response OmpR family regulator